MEKTEDMKFDPTNLNRIIKERGATVPTIHENTKVPVTTLYDWCKGRTMPRSDNLKKVASYLEVSMEELIG